MIIRKIVKFEKHAEDSYSVWYDNLGDQRVILSRAGYNLAKCIDEFLRRAIDPEDIERIVDLTSQLATNDYLICDG